MSSSTFRVISNLIICLYVVILAALLLTPAAATPAPAASRALCNGDDSFYTDGRQPDFTALSKLFR